MEHFHFMPGVYSDYFKNHFSPSFINIPDFLPDNQMFIRDDFGMEHFHFMPGDYSDYFKNHFSPSFINIPDFLPDNQMFIRDEHGKQIEHPAEDHFLSRLVLEDFIDSEFSNLDYFTGLLLLLFKSSLKVKPFFRFSSFLEIFESSFFDLVRDISAMQKSTASGESRNPLLLTRADFSPLATHNSTSPINKSFINSVPGAGTSSSSSSFTTSPLTTTTADFDLMTYINRNFGLNPLALSKLNFESAHLKTVENIASAASMLGTTPGSDNGHNTPGSASKSTLQSSLVNAYLSQDNNGNLPPSPYNGQGGGGADVLNGDVVTQQRKHNSSTNSNHPPINAAKVTPKTAVRSSKKSNSIGKGESPAASCVSCNICGKRFRTNLTLEIHVKSHKSSERPFPCKYCGRSFIQQTHVKQHERCHTNEKPYVCNFCDKSFAQKSGVIQHERIHTGEKPYICRFCPKSYRQMSGLKQHFTKHKDTDPVRDDLTEEELSKLKYPSLTASTSTASSIASNPQQGVKNLNNHSSKLLSINNNNSDNNETSGEKQTISQSPSFFNTSSSSNQQQQQSSSSQYNQQLTSQYFLSSPATSFHPLLTYGGGTNTLPNPLNNNNRHSQQNNSSSCSNNSSANHHNYKNGGGGGFPALFHHHQPHNSPNAHSSNPYNNVMLAANIPPAAANYLLAADFLPPGIFFPPPPPSHPQGPGVGSCGGPSLDFNTITNAAFLFQQQQQQKMAAAAHQFNNNQQQHHNLAHHFQQQSNNNSNNNTY